MSGNRLPPSEPSRYRTADDIVRSILDDHAPTASEISPSGELYRAIERFHANAHRRPGLVNSARRDLVRSHLNRWATATVSASTSLSTPRSSSRNSMSSDANSNSEPYRRFSRDPQPSTSSGAPSLPSLRSLHTSRRSAGMLTSSTASGRGRWRPPVERYPERHRPTNAGPTSRSNNQFLEDSEMQLMLLEQQHARRSRAGQAERDLQQLDELDDANNQLRALLDFTNTPSHPYSDLSFPSPPLQAQDSTDESRRVKRRKLDSDRLSTGFKGFSYGRYGQVEPGPLVMEMVSCDGGIYSNENKTYAAENILRNDATVYCTKGPRCNIVLRHQGSTVFTLKELIIKAPRSNYTYPVQEGMVFVSMNSDELLARTAQYRIQYLPRSSLRRTERETQPLAPIVSIRHNDDGSTMTRAQVRAQRLSNIGLDDEDNEYRVAQIPSEFIVSPPQFQVTTECSDDEGDDPTSRSDWRAPNRIGPLPFESDSSDEGGELADIGVYGIEYRRRRRRRTPLWETREATPEASQEPSRGPAAGELMAPHARFFIERDKSKCTIRFDPPVSGRFILLKMWSPHQDPQANIDIQAVIANGFAGPRYFPAVELR